MSASEAFATERRKAADSWACDYGPQAQTALPDAMKEVLDGLVVTK